MSVTETAELRRCPECGRADPEFQDATTGKMRLGQHRRQAHGVAGVAPKKKKSGDRAPRAPAEKKPPSLAKDIQGVFKLGGTVIAIVDPYCGGRLMIDSAKLSAEMATLLREDAAAARMAKILGRWGGVLGSAFLLLAPMAAHHGLLNPAVVAMIGENPPPPPESNGQGERVRVPGPIGVVWPEELRRPQAGEAEE